MKHFKIFTGDENGLLKAVQCRQKKPAIINLLPLQNQLDKSRNVNLLERWNDNLLVLRDNYVIENWSNVSHPLIAKENEENGVQAEQPRLIQTLPLIDDFLAPHFVADAGQKMLGFYVNGSCVHETDSVISSVIACNSNGNLFHFGYGESMQLVNHETVKTFFDAGSSLFGSNLTRARFHRIEKNLLVTIGQEQELSLWDVEKSLAMSATNLSPSKSGQIPVHCLFKAKNVKLDELDLRVPVHNTDFDWLTADDPNVIVVGTKYHHLRLYDTKAQRRPVSSLLVGTDPIKRVIRGPEKCVYLSDTRGNIFAIDMRKGDKPLWKVTEISGAVTDLFYEETMRKLASVSLDRHLRIHQTHGAEEGQTIHKVYLKQRLSSVIMVPTTSGSNDDNALSVADKKHDDVDGLLGSIEVIDDGVFYREAVKSEPKEVAEDEPSIEDEPTIEEKQIEDEEQQPEPEREPEPEDNIKKAKKKKKSKKKKAEIAVDDDEEVEEPVKKKSNKGKKLNKD